MEDGTISHKEIIERVEKVFPNKLEINFSNPFQLLVVVILSAQTADAKVNQITKKLFERFPTPKDLAEAPLDEIEEYLCRRAICFLR